MERTWLDEARTKFGEIDEAPAKAPQEVGWEVLDPASAAGFETKLLGGIDGVSVQVGDQI